MSRKFTTPLVALAALIGAGSLAACNTVEGVGEDVQQAGDAIEETAQDANDGDPSTP
ncbi:MAG: entericidin A/B family lipoprotein [Caulobacterales bacterium]|jgi:predicted small secreted protein|nr:entericidin A/B family lipoprotein [Caulobacterales bacterium]